MERKYELEARYERDAAERRSIDQRIQNVTQKIADLMKGQQGLIDSRVSLTARMEITQLELAAETTEATPVAVQSTQIPVLVTV